jgi:hypothetical protein
MMLEWGDSIPICGSLDASHADLAVERVAWPCWKPRQEATLMRNGKDEAGVEGTLTKKELQAREGAAAMAEYQAASRALVEKTAQLREMRLAREAAEAEARKAVPAKKVRVAGRQK